MVPSRTRSIPDSDTRNNPDRRIASHNGNHTAAASNSDEFQHLFHRLLTIRYSYERESNQAVQQNRLIDSTHISQNLEELWQALCEMAGLSEGTAPVLPTRRLLQSPTQFWNDTVVNVATPSIRTVSNWRQSQVLEREAIPKYETPESLWTVADTTIQTPCASPDPKPSSIFTESLLSTSTSTPGTSPSLIGNSYSRPPLSGRAPSLTLSPPALPACRAFMLDEQSPIELFLC